ncbi:hypothetical protein MFIFM68171_04980 [Madurella fahalii]|uniref:Uncharacterized protein n=1 Tax=Madurella fahalii TaxID=1157608 RepID=A0ABQ0GAP4_9PEZI
MKLTRFSLLLLLPIATTLTTTTDLIITLPESQYPTNESTNPILYTLAAYHHLTTRIILQPAIAALPNVRLLGHVSATRPPAADDGDVNAQRKPRPKPGRVVRLHQHVADDMRAWSRWAHHGVPLAGIFLDHLAPLEAGGAGDGAGLEEMRRVMELFTFGGDGDGGLRFGGERGELVVRVWNPRLGYDDDDNDDDDGAGFGDGGWRVYEWVMGTRRRVPVQKGEVEGVQGYLEMAPGPDLVVGLEYDIGLLYRAALPDAVEWDVNRRVVSVRMPEDGKGERPDQDVVAEGLSVTVPRVVGRGFAGFLVDAVPSHIELVTELLNAARIGRSLGMDGESLGTLKCVRMDGGFDDGLFNA